jgi:hypothetical protein
LSGPIAEGRLKGAIGPIIPIRQMERMMKLQDVISKAMAKKLMWIEAAKIAGGSIQTWELRSIPDFGG